MLDKDLREIGDLVVNTVLTTKKQLADGWQGSDALAFFPLIMSIPEAVKDAKNALNYLDIITDEEEKELLAYILEKLKDASAKVQEFAKWLVKALIADYMTVKLAMSLGDDPIADTGKK